MKEIINPVLWGFHPDPSVIRVGADYYPARVVYRHDDGNMLSGPDRIWKACGL